MAVSIKDVAKEVGVAPSTVSRAIQNHPSISKETKERVHKAMDRLGYVPNISARNLVKQLSNCVGVILPPLETKERASNPFYLEILGAINQEANHQGITTAVATGSSKQELLENVQLMHRQKRVDGFILLYVAEDDPIIEYLVSDRVPYSLVGQPYKYENDTIYVDNDNQLIGKTAVDYLVSKGHQRILFAANNSDENLFHERYYGYQRACSSAKIDSFPPVLLEKIEDYEIFKTIIEEKNPTAIVAIDDMFALRIMQLLELYGYSIPDDISIVSVNDSIFTKIVHPYLTSINIHVENLGKLSFQQLFEQIKNTEATRTKMIVPHTLIERETVKRLN